MLLPVNLAPWRRKTESEPVRDQPLLSFDAYLQLVEQFSYGGHVYGYPGPGLSYTLPGRKQEEPTGEFRSLASFAYKSNSVAFACMAVRMRVFRQARFKFRDVQDGHLFGAAGLGRLEEPWPGGTTADLLARMIQHADLAGNAFVARRNGGVTVLRPDWVTIVGGVPGDRDSTTWDAGAEVLGYLYQPGGPAGGKDPEPYFPEDVAHFAPIPDPDARFRGMSWLTPLVREVMADKAMTEHRLSFFENGATPNLVVKLPAPDLNTFREYVDLFKQEHEGRGNAYKTMFLAAGADAEVVGRDLQQLEFKITQGGGETRIAAAAGVPPVIVGLSEGLAAATYSNYASARRHFADTTLRDLWQDAAGSLARIVDVPARSELWYDDRAIQFLQEDLKDEADIMSVRATATKTFVDAGYTPESASLAVASNDMSLLVHSGLVSVQLQPPGAQQNESNMAPAVDGENMLRDALLLEIMRFSGARRALEPVAITNNTYVDVPEHRTEIPVNVAAPEVTVEAARVEVPITVETPTVEVPVTIETPRVEVPVTVEPARTDVHVAPAAVEVPVIVEAAQVNVEPPSVNVTVEGAPTRARRRRVELPDGTGATVTEGAAERLIEFDDGRKATVRDEETQDG